MSNNPQLNLIINKDNVLHAETENNVFEYKLPLDQVELYRIIRENNRVLETIVSKGEYSQDTNIPLNICEEDLKKIAELNLFDKIFLGPNPSHDAEECAKEIKKVLQQPSKIQVTTIENKKFFVPWSLVYDGELKLHEKADRNSFWGFKHIVEQVPVPPNKQFKYGSTIDSSNLLLSFNFNKDIDLDYNVNCIQEQSNFFNSINNPNFRKTDRNSEEQLLDAFANQLDDDIVYFYCHAKSGYDINSYDSDTYVRLTRPGKELTLQRLRLYAKHGNFVKEPLVFINACESAGMSPLFYDGFITYFMSRGSRGIVGTLSNVPAVFASKFGMHFFQRLLKRQRTGKIVVDLRKEFLDGSNNLLGLYYVPYCRSNLILSSPILNS